MPLCQFIAPTGPRRLSPAPQLFPPTDPFGEGWCERGSSALG